MDSNPSRLENGQIRVDVDDASYIFDSNAILETAEGDISVARVRDNLYSILAGGRSISAVLERPEPDRLVFTVGDRVVPLELIDHRKQLLETYAAASNHDSHHGEIRAPMPGLVLKVHVTPGSAVGKNDPLIVLEAMKMENEIRAPGAGVISAVMVSPGEAVMKNALLVELVGDRKEA
jgi:pyruvate carboxylase subunit B